MQLAASWDQHTLEQGCELTTVSMGPQHPKMRQGCAKHRGASYTEVRIITVCSVHRLSVILENRFEEGADVRSTRESVHSRLAAADAATRGGHSCVRPPLSVRLRGFQARSVHGSVTFMFVSPSRDNPLAAALSSHETYSADGLVP